MKKIVKLPRSIILIQDDIENQVKYREWLRREIKKKSPYKCYGVASKIRSRKKEFAKDIIQQNKLIVELRDAIRGLSKYLKH